ncbi:MAG: endonuclease/exonuclease/phosphatase family protein [Silvanigrellaceae bacterium]
MHHPKMSIFMLAFLATTAAISGCRSSTSKTRSTSAGELPEQTKLNVTKARVIESNNEIVSLELGSPDETFSGLGTWFFVDAKNFAPQYLGLLPHKARLPIPKTARLMSGQRVDCSRVEGKSVLSALFSANEIKADCSGRAIRIQLSNESPNADAIANQNLDTALRSGASLILADTENSNNLIEITIRGNTVSIAENKPGLDRPARVTFSNSEIQAFFSGQGSLAFPCTNTACAKAASPLTLMRKGNGDLVAIRRDSANSGAIVDNSVQSFRRPGSEGLRISSYNVENFWDDVPDNSKAYDDFSSELSNWYSEGFAERKARRIRDALLAAGLPDAVGLQEIESAANSGRSLELLKPLLAPLGYNYFALGQQAEDNPTAVTTAFISKYPLLENSRLDFRFDSSKLRDADRDDFISASRDPQRVTLALPEGQRLVLLNSHWKSKRDKSPVGDDMRRQIGQLMRSHLDELRGTRHSNWSGIIMGDFNADYREESVQEGLRLATNLATARNSQNSLFDMWQTRSAELQGDYPHDSELTAIDNIVVDQSVLAFNSLVLAHPLRVVGEFGEAGKLLLNGDKQPFRSQIHQIKDETGSEKTFHKDLGYSDHLPLVVEFQRSLSLQKQISAAIFSNNIEQQTAASLPKVAIPESTCRDSETTGVAAPEILNAIASAQRGDCLDLNGQFLLRKTGLFNVAFDLPDNGTLKANERIVIITADRPFGANRAWLRSSLQQSAGKSVTRLRGRLGIVDGVKAIFISQPQADIIIE